MLDSASNPPETYAMSGTPSGGGAERMVINVGGVRHETLRDTLASIPGTRLAKLLHTSNKEVFFDRHAGAFAHILNFYRTGKLHCPPDVCGPLFEEELRFWGLNEADVEPCCWENFHRYRAAEETLARLKLNEEAPGSDSPIQGADGQLTGGRGCMAKMWALFDDPRSSVAAMIIGVVSLLILLVAVCAFCVGTLPVYNGSVFPTSTPSHSYFDEDDDGYNFTLYEIHEAVYFNRGFPLTELFCVLWFSFEFLVRIVCCPNKRKFIFNILNIIDFLSILPFFLELFFYGTPHVQYINPFWPLRVLRFFRLLRVFKILPLSTSFQSLGLTLRASCYDLLLLCISLFVALLSFAGLAHFAEESGPDSQFPTIFHASWWAIVTLTTVGYGDAIPVTLFGRVLASICGLTALLCIAMPIPLLVHRFSQFQALAEVHGRRSAAKKRTRGDGQAGGPSAPPAWGLVYRPKGETTNNSGDYGDKA